MNIINIIKERAKKNVKTIVLPEAEDIRVLEAASIVLNEKSANIILIGNKQEILDKAKNFDLSNANIIEPQNYEKIDYLIDTFTELRKSKGLSRDEAKEILLTNNIYFATMLVKIGIADGMVAGAINYTSDIFRPALQIVKSKPNCSLVSSFFLMEVPDCQYGEEGVFVFSDCGLCQNPTSEQLADIALTAGESFEMFTSKKAKIAMLSHSTKGSSSHPDVDKVVNAVKIAKDKAPNVMLDGELQLDSAIIPEVAKSKAPNSEIAGYANVLVFPDLDAGNIGYKLVQRLAKAVAIGPISQGLLRPINDLSRSCSVTDITTVVYITAIQAQEI